MIRWAQMRRGAMRSLESHVGLEALTNILMKRLARAFLVKKLVEGGESLSATGLFVLRGLFAFMVSSARLEMTTLFGRAGSFPSKWRPPTVAAFRPACSDRTIASRPPP